MWVNWIRYTSALDMSGKRIHIKLEGTKAFSVNASHYAKIRVKTKECRLWEEQVNSMLSQVDFSILSGVENFQVEYIFTYPKYIFFNKQGKISSKTFDVDNCIKLLQDLVFAKIGVDDRFVTKIVASKCAGDDYSIQVVVESINS